MGRGELHIQLVLDYADDPKLEGVSRGARLLYIDGIIKARRLKSDGFLSDVQVEKIAHPETPARARKQAGELVASGAWERHECGFVNTGYLKRNLSRAQIEALQEEASEAGIRGNHERWHKNKISPTCPLCPESEPPDDREVIAPPDDAPIGSESGGDRVSSLETETEKETTSRPRSNEPEILREDVERLCTHLADWIVKNGSKQPTIGALWRNEARLLLDNDKRPLTEALALVDWCQRDEFWAANVLSMAKFRKRYDQLRLRARSGQHGRPANVDLDDEKWL